MSDLPQRAYALISGKYRHLYIIESYQQMDIMGGGSRYGKSKSYQEQ